MDALTQTTVELNRCISYGTNEELHTLVYEW